MSALGQKQTLDWRPLMSALPPKADIAERDRHVRFATKADIAALIRPERTTSVDGARDVRSSLVRRTQY
jgi:hypothetical protein